MQSGELPATSADKMVGKGVSDVAPKPAAAAAMRIVRKRKNFAIGSSSSFKEKKKKIEKQAVVKIIPGNAVVVKMEEGLPRYPLTLAAWKQQADGEAAGLKELEELRAKAEADAELKEWRAKIVVASARLKVELRDKAEDDAKLKELRAKAEADAKLKVLRARAEADTRFKELRAKVEANVKLKEVKAKAEACAKLMEELRVKAEADAKLTELRANAEADAKLTELRAKAKADTKLKEELIAKAEADAKLKEELRAKAEADTKLKTDDDNDKAIKAAAEDTLFLLKLKKHIIVDTLSSQHQSSRDPAINLPLPPARSQSRFIPPATSSDIPGPSSSLSVEEELILLRREVQEMKGIERALNKEMGSLIDRVCHLEKDNKYCRDKVSTLSMEVASLKKKTPAVVTTPIVQPSSIPNEVCEVPYEVRVERDVARLHETVVQINCSLSQAYSAVNQLTDGLAHVGKERGQPLE